MVIGPRETVAILLLATLGGITPAIAADGNCAASLIPNQSQQATARSIEPDDLLRLRDIGSVIGYAERDSPFAISPDGRQVAFQIRRADPVTNTYCLGMIVVPIAPKATPVVVDTGGELIRKETPNRNLKNFPTGSPRDIVPRWSPDGQWIAYLRKDEGTMRVWRARANGHAAEALTKPSADILAFTWSSDGRTIIYSTDAARQAEREALEKEGRNGFVYDRRFWPVATARPFPEGPVIPAYWSMDIAAGAVRPATESEVQILVGPAQSSKTAEARRSAVTANGDQVAWIAALDPKIYNSPLELHVRTPTGAQTCDHPSCRGRLINLWWTADFTELLFLRAEGAAGRSQLALYRWNPARSASPVRILATDDILIGCQMVENALLCGREASNRPRRIVLIDAMTGHEEEIFDPNPEFRSLKLGRTERLIWRNQFGVESFGEDSPFSGYHRERQGRPTRNSTSDPRSMSSQRRRRTSLNSPARTARLMHHRSYL